jgi:hypothetical protein
VPTRTTRAPFPVVRFSPSSKKKYTPFSGQPVLAVQLRNAQPSYRFWPPVVHISYTAELQIEQCPRPERNNGMAIDVKKTQDGSGFRLRLLRTASPCDTQAAE